VSRPEQYKLHAYVCGNACLQRIDNEGTLSFMMVFMKRPADCRYAICTRYNVDAHDDEVVVWDLYEVQQSLHTGKLVTPEPIRTCDNMPANDVHIFKSNFDMIARGSHCFHVSRKPMIDVHYDPVTDVALIEGPNTTGRGYEVRAAHPDELESIRVLFAAWSLTGKAVEIELRG
jgi:hypothetical protein